MKILLPGMLLVLAISACGAAKAPSPDTSSPETSAVLDKLDERCRNLLASTAPFSIQAKSNGFVTGEPGVLFDLQLEPGTQDPQARAALSGLGSLSFMDVSLARASVYLSDRQGLAAVSRLSFVRFIHATHSPVSR